MPWSGRGWFDPSHGCWSASTFVDGQTRSRRQVKSEHYAQHHSPVACWSGLSDVGSTFSHEKRSQLVPQRPSPTRRPSKKKPASKRALKIRRANPAPRAIRPPPADNEPREIVRSEHPMEEESMYVASFPIVGIGASAGGL